MERDRGGPGSCHDSEDDMMAEMTPKCPMMYVSYLASPSQQLTKETCVISPTLQMSD